MKRTKKSVGVKARYTKDDITRINNAFYKKVDEYSKLSLEELKELYPILGGSYRTACLEVVKDKLQQEKEAKLNEAIVEAVEEVKQTNNPEDEKIQTD